MSSEGPIRFGVFEVDLGARELRKRGVRVRLQDQPFRVLEALLERPGEIVTREELKERLWAQDEFVEFDRSLNTAVQKIREALGDSVASPRFLETVPRQGYKFVAPVQPAGEAEPTPPPPLPPRWLAVAALATVGVVALLWWLRPLPEASFDPSAYRLRQLTNDEGLTFQPTLSRDGRLVAYASDRGTDGNLDIYVQQVAGGAVTRVTDDPADDYAPHFSPSGDRIVFRSDRGRGGVHIVKTLGREPPRLLAAQGRAPRFSPDGGRVCFFRGNNRSAWGASIYVMPVAGGQEARLAAELPTASHPVWAPDGEKLLFVGSDPNLGIGWWSCDARGREPAVPAGAAERILSFDSVERVFQPGMAVRPSGWLPGGREAVFAGRSGSDARLWKMPLDPRDGKVSGDPVPITFGAGAPSGPSVDTRGAIAFTQLEPRHHIMSLPLEGEPSDMALLVRDVAFNSEVSISRDGRKLAYQSSVAGQVDVRVADLVSGETAALTDTPAEEQRSVISPDGRWVAIQIDNAVFVTPSDGGPLKKLCDDCSGLTNWSSDSKRVLLEGRAMSWLDRDTGKLTTIYRHEIHMWDKRFSPDDRWLAFHMPVDEDGARNLNRRRLFIAAIDEDSLAPEDQWISITDGKSYEGFSWWAADGDSLYYWSYQAEGPSIRRVRLDSTTKLPLGPADEVIRFAELGRRRIAAGLSPRLSVSEGRIVFKLSEMTGNIWIMEPSDAE